MDVRHVPGRGPRVEPAGQTHWAGEVLPVAWVVWMPGHTVQIMPAAEAKVPFGQGWHVGPAAAVMRLP